MLGQPSGQGTLTGLEACATGMSSADQRATPRIHAKIGIFVEGRDIEHKPFQEESHTVLINEGGALIALAAQLEMQDHIRITNKSTGSSAECRIAWRSAEPIQGRWSYGIALLESAENFWVMDRT